MSATNLNIILCFAEAKKPQKKIERLVGAEIRKRQTCLFLCLLCYLCDRKELARVVLHTAEEYNGNRVSFFLDHRENIFDTKGELSLSGTELEHSVSRVEPPGSCLGSKRILIKIRKVMCV
jgi:hypothetical protein